MGPRADMDAAEKKIFWPFRESNPSRPAWVFTTCLQKERRH